MIDQHHSAIVVGTGFGGAVMAYRLAEAGIDVCVLERGKAYPPGSFPRTPAAMKENFWDPACGRHGLFDVRSFRNLDAVVSSGLGGGSLIYANVLLRKDERWFVTDDPAGSGGGDPWPVDRAALDPHYDRVERALGRQTFPIEHEPYRSVPKVAAFRDAAKRAGLDWGLPGLAVTFGNPGERPVPGQPIRERRPNLHRRPRTTCTLCGECNVGCNQGSKNTLDFNYLTEARRLGARLETRCEVLRVAPRDGGGYVVEYVEHLPENEGRATDTSALPRKRLTCDRLVLAAGTFGTTRLLLHNRGALTGLGAALGSRFSGNGDFLTFAYLATEAREGGASPRLLDPTYGPVITSYARGLDALDGGDGRGFYIEDAGFPAFVAWAAEAAGTPGVVARAGRFLARWYQRLGRRHLRSDVADDLVELFGPCATTRTSLQLLGIGRETAVGRRGLDDDGRLELAYRMDRSSAYFQRVRGAMAAIADARGAQLVDDPRTLRRRMMTVHPLGGCPMGRDAREGVVDAHGEVFGHEGLFVADGSVMPGAVGANPALTIAALADRFADHLVDGWKKGRAHETPRRRRAPAPARIVPPEAFNRASRHAHEGRAGADGVGPTSTREGSR